MVLRVEDEGLEVDFGSGVLGDDLLFGFVGVKKILLFVVARGALMGIAVCAEIERIRYQYSMVIIRSPF